MASIGVVNTLLLLGALLVLMGIFSSLIASRFGAPLLLVFLVLGMLAGEDGPGGLRFNDYQFTYLVGSLALAVILFDGGLRTKLSSFRGVLVPSVLLATAGVVITAALTGVFAAYVLGLSWLEGLLIGSVVASTDAAAVFFLLRTGGLQLRHRVGSTLEIESGTNDPVAVFLTIILVELVLAGEGGPTWDVFGMLGRQAVIGAALGVAGGLGASWLLNRVELPAGLHPLFVVSSAVLIYALAAIPGGSGFLAVYLAGLVMGNRPIRAFADVLSFHDTATWLCQIIMFLVLGLLVTPSRLVGYAAPALVIAVILMLVARPVAVWLCLWPFRFSWQEKAFVSWVGLRGAVAIFLASIPVLSGVPRAEIYFNVAFFVVLVSLMVQGWTITPTAKRLGLALPRAKRQVRRVELDLPGQLEYEMVGYPVAADSAVLGHVALPGWARLVLVIRDNRVLNPTESGPLQEGDYAYFLAPPWQVYRLDRLFSTPTEAREAYGEAFGEFTINGDATLGTLADLYGLTLAPEMRGMTVVELFSERFDEQPQTGDRLPLGAATLVVREVDGDRVLRVGLRLPDTEGGAAGPPLLRRRFRQFLEPAEAWIRRTRALRPGRRNRVRLAPAREQGEDQQPPAADGQDRE